MTPSRMSYAVITPARDEAQNLARLAPCLIAQHTKPVRWVVVDNGSKDGTADVVGKFAEEHTWIELVQLNGPVRPNRETAVCRALEAGLAALSDLPDIVVKVDADISFEPEFFDHLVAGFEREVGLGIASGSAYERSRTGVWQQRHGTGAGVWGAARAFRRECLDEIAPLDPRLGWDGIDILKSTLRGWNTRVIYEAQFKHHRPEGDRDGSRWNAWVAEGAAAHYMNYRLPYLVTRTVFRGLHDPRAFGILWGYVRSHTRGEPRLPDPEVVKYLRSQQRLSQMRSRAREATRKRDILLERE